MRKDKIAILLLSCLFATVVSCGQRDDEKTDIDIQIDTTKSPVTQLKTVKDSLSWGYGQALAKALHGDYFDTALNHDLVLQAFVYTLKGGEKNLLSEEEAIDIYQYANMNYSTLMQRKAQTTARTVDSLQQVYFANLTKNNPKVKKFDMGEMAFYYEELKPGTGPNAEYAQRIRFDYRSFNILNGQPIDQTYGNREPIVHVVGNPMFPALIQAFQLMNTGSIYRFYIPYQLAFGAEGSGGVVPPFTPVIYEIELHELYEN